MCGITGGVSFGENSYLTKIQHSTELMKNRGPDHQGVFTHEGSALGHRRLAIIDPSPLGNQPMTDQDERYHLVCNGEIYNFQPLRQELILKGYSFRGNSDSEVLLALYQEYGPDCLDKIHGFFSFAVYDKRENSLFIARDRFGIKPLYYYHHDDVLLFSSDLKSLMSYGIPKKIDMTSLLLYFQLTYIPHPHSLLENVFKLEPGHYLTFKESKLSLKKYYEPAINQVSIPGNQADLEEKLRQSFETSIQERLVSDVPLGAFLSGGIDSSAIVASASKFMKPLKTFSIGFTQNSFYDETKYAELVAKKFKTEHHTFRLNENDFFSHIFSILDSIDEPFADSSAIPVFILSRFVKDHVKVALSGDGGDELFAGYNKHSGEIFSRSFTQRTHNILKGLTPKLKGSKESFWQDKIRQLNKLTQVSTLPLKDRYWNLCLFNSRPEVHDLFKQDITQNVLETESRKRYYLRHLGEDFNQFLLSDVSFILPNDMLKKVDLMSMANGLEVRVPFLDHRLVELALSIPAKKKINLFDKKIILKQIMKDQLPPEILGRRKQGFSVPLMKFLKTEFKSKILDEYLEEGFIERQGIFDPESIQKIRNLVQSPETEGDPQALIWSMVCFQHWYKKWIGD